MGDEIEKLAFELASRTLAQQEAVLNELRARTGTLLAASSLATSLSVVGTRRKPWSVDGYMGSALGGCLGRRPAAGVKVERPTGRTTLTQARTGADWGAREPSPTQAIGVTS